MIGLRAGLSPRALLAPSALYALGVLIPDSGLKALLLGMSLLVMFGAVIVVSFRRTHTDETRFLEEHGPTPWVAKRRQMSMYLLTTGVLSMVAAITLDAASGHRSIVTVLLFASGSGSVGFGLVRSHAVLATYFGRPRARWLEVVQIVAGVSRYALVLAAETTPEADLRLKLRLIALVPFAAHFVFVWLPLARTQEEVMFQQ